MNSKQLSPDEFLTKAVANHNKIQNRRGSGDRKVFFDSNRNLFIGQLSHTDPDTGKRSRPKVYGKTEKEARTKMRALERKIEEGMNPGRSNVHTVASWVQHYFDNYRKTSNLAIKTIEAEEMWVRVHIIPGLGHIKLAKLSTDTIQAFYRSCMERSEDQGGPLSPLSVRHIHGVLKRSLQKAVELKHIHQNPTNNVELPKKDELPLRSMTREQLAKFLEVATQQKFRYLTAIMLAVITGLRRSEVFGLRWEDIDIVNHVVRVRQVLLTTTQGLRIVTRTKTKESRSAVGIPAKLSELLTRHKALQDEEREAAMKRAEEDRAKFGDKVRVDEYYEENDLVFRQENGRRVDPNSVRRSYSKLLEKAGLPHFRLHDLRHTFVALLIDSGVHAKRVQMAARHASITQTMDRYGHLFAPIVEGVSEALADIVPSETGDESKEQSASEVSTTGDDDCSVND